MLGVAQFAVLQVMQGQAVARGRGVAAGGELPSALGRLVPVGLDACERARLTVCDLTRGVSLSTPDAFPWHQPLTRGADPRHGRQP